MMVTEEQLKELIAFREMSAPGTIGALTRDALYDLRDVRHLAREVLRTEKEGGLYGALAKLEEHLKEKEAR